MHACGCARNRRQETNVLIVSVLFAVVVNLALRSNAQGRIEDVGMRKLTILVGLGMYVYYYRTYEKAVSGGGGKGVHVLRDTTSRGLCV